MIQTEINQPEIEIVGTSEPTMLGLAMKAFVLALGEQLHVNRHGYTGYHGSDFEQENNKSADALNAQIGEYKFFGKVPKEEQGVFIGENTSMKGANGNEHWRLYFKQESETKSGKCVIGTLFIQKQVPLPQYGEDVVEYVQIKRQAMIPKSVMAGDDHKRYWWVYYKAIMANSMRPWESFN